MSFIRKLVNFKRKTFRLRKLLLKVLLNPNFQETFFLNSKIMILRRYKSALPLCRQWGPGTVLALSRLGVDVPSFCFC
jgi:hypothetical protein